MAEKLPELEAIDEAASLIDDETPEIGGLTVFKSGLAASPELRTGLLVTVLMALTAAAGKLMIPILVQLVLDRGLLGEQGYRGEGAPPELPLEVRVTAAERYIAAFEQVSGQPFAPNLEAPTERIARNLSLG